MIEDAASSEALAGAVGMAYEYVYSGPKRDEDWGPLFAPGVPEALRRRVAASDPDARACYLGNRPRRGIPRGTGPRRRPAGPARWRARRAAHVLQGRYLTPALDLDEAGRVQLERARAAAGGVNHCAARHDRTLDAALHARLLERWLWSLATSAAEIAGDRAANMQSRHRGQLSPRDYAASKAALAFASDALSNQVAAAERYAGALRGFRGRDMGGLLRQYAAMRAAFLQHLEDEPRAVPGI